ncbi:MAG: acyl-CoA thioesterase [Acidimicrobiales bacterium]
MTAQTPAELLAEPVGDRIQVSEGLWGFGGLHGGLSLAVLTSAMGRLVPGRQLRSATAQFLRPVRGKAALRAGVLRQGRSMSVTDATAANDDEVLVHASAIWGTGEGTAPSTFGPTAPAVPPPDDCSAFAIPPEIVAFGQHVEVRPIGAARPFTGGTTAELLAWIRLVADDLPPDELRMITLIDALAPSYAAVMPMPGAVPTIELTVRPAVGIRTASSPWTLIRATTRSATPDGWIDERIDVWGPDATHLASAQQLRVVRPI